ncbi:Cysteine protease atg4c [Irineochytrium annulatum]|nr:Cysteine protease atg4c [Irineochytrium annulatum]
MALYVATDGVIFNSEVREMCMQRREEDGKPEWRSVLILVPVRLGLDSLNPLYYPLIKQCFAMPHCVGIAGGRPNSSLFFMGYQGDGLIYLDPHYMRAAVDVKDTSSYTPEELASYHCPTVRAVNISSLDPSMVLGFYCRTEASYLDFLKTAQTLTQGKTPLFSIQESAPNYADAEVIGEQYHGEGVRQGPFFEGYYVKTALKDGGSAIFIPGVFISAIPSSPNDKPDRTTSHAFIMFFRTPNAHLCLYYAYPLSKFTYANNASEFGFNIAIAGSRFSSQGFSVDLLPEDLISWDHDATAELDGFLSTAFKYHSDAPFDRLILNPAARSYEWKPLRVKGDVEFLDVRPFPRSFYAPTIMGPFAFLPAMECYHGVVSMHHRTRGEIRVGDEAVDLNEGIGYLEKDHGYNFPKTNVFKKEEGSCLLISVADVPLMSDIGALAKLVSMGGSWGDAALRAFRITGFLVMLHHEATNTTHNMSLYAGGAVKLIRFRVEEVEDGHFVHLLALEFTKGNMRLIVQIRRPLGSGVPLYGPAASSSKMTLLVEESIVDVQIKCCLEVGGKIVFDDVGFEAGLEVVGDIASMQERCKGSMKASL